MLKIKHRRRGTFFAVCLLCISCLLAGLGLSLLQKETVFAEGGVSFVEETVKAQYGKGETLEIPAAKVLWQDREYSASRSSLEYPDGRVYAQEEYALTQAGRYCVSYYADCNGENVCAKVYFQVAETLFSVSGSDSAAYYGTSEKIEGVNGIVVRLNEGDSFIFNKPIDLSDNFKSDNLLRFFTLPKALGVSDVWGVRVRLTDVADASNYVEVYSVTSPYNRNEEENPLAHKNVSTGAGANGQPLTGLHLRWVPPTGYPFVAYDGQKYAVFDGVNINADIGYPSLGFSFSAREGYGKLPYELSMDYAERQLFGSRCAFAMSGSGAVSNGMIIDLDEPLFFKQLWDGFTTGEVILSLSAEAYVNSDFSFIITNIDGEDLSSGDYLDGNEPSIRVQFPLVEGNTLPTGVVNCPYRLFNAAAVDNVDGLVTCKTYVYKGYETNVPVQINVKDGTFIPKEAGEYDVVYVAYDHAGNRAEKVVKIRVKAENELALSIGTLPSGERKTGTSVPLPAADVTGAEGAYTLSVAAKLQGKDVTYPVTKNADGTYSFTPLYAGTYNVTYACTDYNGELLETVVVTVEANGKAFFPTDAVLPSYYIKNGEYKFPSLTGYDLQSGVPIEKTADLAYAFDNGSFVAYTGGTVTVEANEKVQLRYTIGETTKFETVMVADVNYGGKLSVKDYFQGESFTSVADLDGAYYTTEQDGTLTFVRALLVSDFSMQFRISTMNFQALTITLTDAENPFNTWSVSLAKEDSGYRLVKVGDGAWQLDPKILVGELLTLRYQNGGDMFTVDKTAFATEGFTGFDGHVAYLSFTFTGVTGVSTLDVTSVNGQRLSQATSDYAPPKYYYEINSGTKTIGEEIVISRFLVMDVLQLTGEVSLTIKGPDGKTCSSTDGVLMSGVKDFSREYHIAVTAYGTYKITGTVSDGNMGEDEFNLNIVSKDLVSPVLTLKEIRHEGAANKNVKLAECTAEDNVDGNLRVSVFVIVPGGKTIAVNGSFTPTEAGLYTVLYYATDEAGNVGFASYEILIKE